MSSPSALLRSISSQLGRVRGPDGRGWYSALCPFHDDRNPSFGFTESGFKCHGCGAQGSLPELAQELGIAVDRPGPVRLEQADADALLHNRGLRPDTIRHFRIEADLQRQAWRFPVGEPGYFKLKAFDPARKPKYSWDPRKPADGNSYNLKPQQPGTEVWLVEGEPDVWIMHQAGLPAFTFTGGAENVSNAGIKAVAEAGFRQVNVCYDNDDTGRDGARKVTAGLLQAGVNAEIRILPPEVGEKGDVTTLYNLLANEDEQFRAALRELPSEISERVPSEAPEIVGWGPPVPFHALDLPSFPTDALPEWLREFVEAEAIATQTPPDLAAMLALSASAAALATVAEVEVRPGWREPLNLFTATILPPGNRKSAVLSDVAAPLEEHEREEVLRLAPEVAQAQSTRKIKENALQKAQRDAGTHSDPNSRHQAEWEAKKLIEELSQTRTPVLPRLLAEDATPEALTSLLAEQGGRIAVLSAEGGVFDLMAGRYSMSGGPNLEVYLKGHAGDPLRVDRKGRPPEFIARPALTLGLAVQPEVLRRLADRAGFHGRGLLGRFLYALPRSPLGSRKVDPPPVSLHVREHYRRKMRALLRLAPAGTEQGSPSSHVLHLSPEAEDRLREFHGWVEPQLGEFGELGAMTDWGGKLVGAVVRITGILHLATHAGETEPWAKPIVASTLDQAIRIGKYLIPHARAAYRQMGGDPQTAPAHYAWRWIKRHGLESFSLREIHRGLEGRFPLVQEMERALEPLVERGYLRLAPAPEGIRPGRKPSPRYEVNPLALQDGSTRHNRQNETGETNSVDCVDPVWRVA